MFWNLLNNAIKFSAPGGRVMVDAEMNDGEVMVTVRDSGQGITPDFLPFVFERFRQADGSKTRLHGGLGLGLALVKSLVEAHHGMVEAESGGAGEGALFRVTLPLRTPEVAPGNAAEKPEPKGPHLMIVEDDQDTLEMLRGTLAARGFRVTACESAAQTLEVASANKVDLVLSDIGMPEMDGFQMIQRLREISGYEDVPAIALSGYASAKDARSALAAGFTAHVSKPIDPAELVALITTLLEGTVDPERRD